MAFERYDEVPIYLGRRGGYDYIETFVLAKDFSFSTEKSYAPNRIAGRIITPNGYSITGVKKSTISLNTYVDGSTGFESEIIKCLFSTDSRRIRVGQTLFEECYLDSLSFSISPFLPVVLSASFVCFRTPLTPLIKSSNIGYSALNLGNGAFSTITISPGTEAVSIMDSSFSFKPTREPIFSPNYNYPIRVNLLSCEMEAQIKCGGLGEILRDDLQSLDLKFEVETLSGTICFSSLDFNRSKPNPKEDYYITSLYTTQNLSFDEGGYTTGTLNLSSILY